MTVDEVIDLLKRDSEVIHQHVLVREIKVSLDVGHDDFQPLIGIKIYKRSISDSKPYHFEVSHHVKTPGLADAYHPSGVFMENENNAILEAISTSTRFIKEGIEAGHTPVDDWLIPSERF